MTLSDAEIERYSRQLVMPEWSAGAQAALGSARAVVVGLGALGSPVATYLAGAGVGRLDLIDSDVVELSNLARQTIHATADVGAPKVETAARRLAELNPGVELGVHRTRLEAANARELVAGASVVVDCSDSFDTRYAVNDACCAEGVALVEGGVLGLGGLVLSVLPGISACYRCAFPTPPPPGAVPSCREAGVLGPVAGVVGSHQALEAVKLITGVGEPLVGRLLQLEARDATQTVVRLRRKPDCPACGSAVPAPRSSAAPPGVAAA